MSTWISDRRAGAVVTLAALLILAACFENVSLERAASRVGLADGGPGSVTVLDGALTIAGPDAYCIDDEATRESDRQAFVLLARCRSDRQPSPVLSATVSGHGAPGSGTQEELQRLAAFLATTAGRAQLSRRGEAGDVRIEETLLQDGALWLRIHDEGNPETLHPTYWRAIMPLAERVVTLSVMSAREHPVGSAAELQALRDFVASMRAANDG